jgi:tetraacyldisaccharide 4'-kinase
VHLEEPKWWYGDAPGQRPRLLAPLLAPLGQLYGWLAQSRYHRRQPYRSRFPVICVGNFTAGGTGKTPLAMFIARLLLAQGGLPVFLTRGYGGSEPGPAWVEDTAGAARRFGDEPLLLARVAPTLVARDRKAGVRAIEDSGRRVTTVIMDDGLLNPALVKDLAIAVVDGGRGLGNGEVIPAGPLRAPMEFQLGLVDAIVVTTPRGDPPHHPAVKELLRHRFHGPVLEVAAVPRGETDWLSGAPVVAFAGIANPARFFALLESLGARVLERVAFPDHHVFRRADAERLLALAHADGVRLVTTEKDWVRLAGEETLPAELLERTRPLAIEMVFEDRDLGRLTSLIATATQHPGYPKRASRPPQL